MPSSLPWVLPPAKRVNRSMWTLSKRASGLAEVANGAALWR